MPDATRRAVLAGAAAVASSPVFAGLAAATHGAADQIKMEACLDGHGAVWSYRGLIYSVRPGEQPRALLGIVGGSAAWARPLSDGNWQMRGATLSFFTDPESGAFLDSFINPLNGRRMAVRPNFLTGGSLTFPADGSGPHFSGRSIAGESTPGGFSEANAARALGRAQWNVEGQTVTLMTDRAFEVPVQPHLEARTIFADRRAFLDPAVRRLPARLATTTITPWLAWMDMADAAGHLVWHCAGQKWFDVADLPADYRRRAGPRLNALAAPPIS